MSLSLRYTTTYTTVTNHQPGARMPLLKGKTMKTATSELTAYVEVRSQPAKGTWPRQGPDTYVAVQVVPEGVQRLKALNHIAAAKRGIEIVHCGEGYHDRTGPRSALGVAIAEAHAIADRINNGELDAT